MKKRTTENICAICAAAILACGALAGCSGNSKQDSGTAESSSAVTANNASFTTDPALKSEIRKAFSEAAGKPFENAEFDMSVKTTVSDNGKTGESTATRKGQLVRGGDGDKVHFDYALNAGTDNEVGYEMFADAGSAFVKQDGVLYGGVDGARPSDYVDAVAAPLSEAVFSKMLDSSYGYNLVGEGDDTVIKMKVEGASLAGSNMVDASALPQGSELGMAEIYYTISPDARIKSIRLSVSTSKPPQTSVSKTAMYKVEQRCDFSRWDEAKAPEWPTNADLASQNLDIKTDEDGRQYIVNEDGAKYYVESIDDDGTVRLSSG